MKIRIGRRDDGVATILLVPASSRVMAPIAVRVGPDEDVAVEARKLVDAYLATPEQPALGPTNE